MKRADKIKWRIAEISNPSTPAYDPNEARKYEVETVWDSGEVTPFALTGAIPPSVVRVGRTYRVRVQHKDTSGRWSHWPDPIQFVTTQPDLTPWISNLMVTLDQSAAATHKFIRLRVVQTP